MVADGEDHRVGSACGRKHHRAARRRKPDRIGQEVEQDLPDAALVGHETADVGRGALLQDDAVLDQPVLHAHRRRRHGGANIDRAKIKRNGARADRGQIEDIVDDGKQGIARGTDVAEILGLPRRQRTGGGIAE